jgi:hypothetical protein
LDLNLNMITTFDVDRHDAISGADDRILVMRKLPETARPRAGARAEAHAEPHAEPCDVTNRGAGGRTARQGPRYCLRSGSLDVNVQ